MTQHTNNRQSIKLSLQTRGIKVSGYLKGKIQSMIKKLKKHLPEISWMDIYLKTTQDAARPKMVTVRFGIPGPDIVASDSGVHWKTLLKNTEKRIIRQLKKRKASLKKNL